MIRGLIQSIIKRRNPNFEMDTNLDLMTLMAFLMKTLIEVLRGMKCVFYFRNPKGAIFGRGVQLNYTHKIRWGKYLKLGKQVTLSALGKGGIKLGDNVGIGSFSNLVTSTSINQMGEEIWIGDNVGIGEFAYIGGAGGVKIGAGTIVGQYFSCHPENHNYDNHNLEIRHQGVTRRGIEIGSDCWIGSKVTILDGVEVGNHSIIAAGAVVTRSFPPYSVLGGVPAKTLKTRK